MVEICSVSIKLDNGDVCIGVDGTVFFHGTLTAMRTFLAKMKSAVENKTEEAKNEAA